jgi:hypothetical protein
MAVATSIDLALFDSAGGETDADFGCGTVESACAFFAEDVSFVDAFDATVDGLLPFFASVLVV